MQKQMEAIMKQNLEQIRKVLTTESLSGLADIIDEISAHIDLLNERNAALALELDTISGKYQIVSDMVIEKNRRVDQLTHVIDRDRYVVSAGIHAVETAINARSWVLQGRGPYEWDDDDYRKEFGVWMEEVYRTMNVLRNVAFDKTDCTTDEVKVNEARKAAYEIIKAPHSAS